LTACDTRPNFRLDFSAGIGLDFSAGIVSGGGNPTRLRLSTHFPALLLGTVTGLLAVIAQQFENVRHSFPGKPANRGIMGPLDNVKLACGKHPLLGRDRHAHNLAPRFLIGVLS
jgi:hypothetical protein